MTRDEMLERIAKQLCLDPVAFTAIRLKAHDVVDATLTVAARIAIGDARLRGNHGYLRGRRAVAEELTSLRSKDAK